MKRTISIIALAMCFVFAFGSFAMAATKPTDSIQWDSRADCISRLSISGTTATCRLNVTASHSTDNITATVMLQKKKSDGTYDNVQTWNKLTGKGSLEFNKNYSPVDNEKNTYRLKSIIYVIGSGGTDTITKFAY